MVNLAKSKVNVVKLASEEVSLAKKVFVDCNRWNCIFNINKICSNDYIEIDENTFCKMWKDKL